MIEGTVLSVTIACCARQGCQMVCFQTKNPSFGKIWNGKCCDHLEYFTAIWYNLLPFDFSL
jgi:hypothetical protein